MGLINFINNHGLVSILQIFNRKINAFIAEILPNCLEKIMSFCMLSNVYLFVTWDGGYES